MSMEKGRVVAFLVESGLPSATSEEVAEKTGLPHAVVKQAILDLIDDRVVINGSSRDGICAIVGERTRIAYELQNLN